MKFHGNEQSQLRLDNQYWMNITMVTWTARTTRHSLESHGLSSLDATVIRVVRFGRMEGFWHSAERRVICIPVLEAETWAS